MNRFRSGAILSLLLLAGCGGDGNDGTARLLAELEAARVRWADSGLTSYAVTQSRACFCPGPFEWTVVVSGGQPAFIDSVRDPVPGSGPQSSRTLEQLALGLAMSVEQTFDWIRQEAETASRVDASFDPGLGYPTRVVVDRIAGAVDDEMTWTFEQPVAVGACTLVACFDELRLVLTPGAGGFPDGDYVVTVSVPQPQGTATLPCSFRVSNDPLDCPVVPCVPDADCGAHFLTGPTRLIVPFPVIEGTLGIDVSIDGVSVASEVLDAAYARSQPNGPLCAPVCYFLEHEIPLP